MNFLIDLPDYWQYKKMDGDSRFTPAISSASAIDAKNNRAYILGGFDSTNNLNSSLYSFDFTSESFTLIDELPISGRINHRMFLTKENYLSIIGGYNELNPKSTDSGHYFCDDILLYRLDTKCIEKIDTVPRLLNRGQFTACYDEIYNIVYFYGGFDRSDLYKFDLNNKKIEKIIPEGEKFDARAGMVSEILPDGQLFIFSGFSTINNIPICHNNYYLYNPINNFLIKKECNEVIGRTFSKSFLYPQKNKVILFSGTLNGMEISRAFYYYDYLLDKFNGICIENNPVDLLEPLLLYSNISNKIYIIGGGTPISPTQYRISQNIWILDLNLIDQVIS